MNFALTVDMLAFAIDHHSPATVILVAGDRDYAYAMSTLRLRQYTVVLIVPSAHVPESLVSQASVVIDWNYAILRNRPDIDTPPVRQPYRDLDEDVLERLVREIQDSNEDPAVTLISSSRHTTTATGDTHVAQPAPTGTPKVTGILPETPGHHRVGSAASRARSTTQSTQAVPDIDRDPASPSTANDTLSDGGVADDRVSTANEIQDATYDPLARPPIMSPRLGRYHEIAEPGSPPIVNFPPSPSPSATFKLTPSHSRTISGGTPVSYNDSLSQRTVPTAAPSLPTPIARRSGATSALKSADNGSVSAIMDDSILPSDHAAVMDALGLDDDDDCGNNEIALNVSTDDPRLTEVDNDTSCTYVMNAVSSRFNHDLARSPPANDTSSPISEPSGTLGSQQSLSAPSAPDPNITIPNVGIGSSPRVMSSVISDNSGNDSSGYQSLSMESVEDRIRRLTPPQFLPLINQLLLARSKGNMRPERLMIATALLRHRSNVYKRAGVSNFWGYILQAGQASLVEYGEWSDTWIGLHPNLFEETMVESFEDKIRRFTPPRFLPLINQLLLANSKGIVKPGRSKIAVALIQDDKDVYKRVGVTNFWDYVTQAEQASLIELGGWEVDPWISLHPSLYREETTLRSPIPSTAHSNSSPAPHDNIEAKIRRLVPPQFLPLIDQLLLARSKGIMKPGMSTIAVALIREGVTTFWEYVTQAEQASLIELGGWEGGTWISLHPDLFKEETTLKSPTPLPAHSSSSPAPQDTVNRSTSSTAPLPHATITNSSKIPSLPTVVDPLCFQPLIACLLNIHRGGMHQPLRSTVGLIIKPAVYSRAGVGSMREYLALAVGAGIVETGGADGQAWVRLHPDVLSGKRTFR